MLQNQIKNYFKQGKYTGLISLFSVNNLVERYEGIKSKPGNMSSRAKELTLDGISLKYLQKIRQILIKGQYNFSVKRQVLIPKKDRNNFRFLILPPARDKIILSHIAKVLQLIFESEIRDYSHGFRSDKRCHTALKQVSYTFNGITWVIEGDIEKCFDQIDHTILLTILADKIEDDKFIALIRKRLRYQWYDEKNKLHRRKKGVPQGSPLRPILINIYLNELDKFITSEILKFTCGNQRRKSIIYSQLQYRLYKSVNSYEKKELRKKIRLIYSKDYIDPNFKRLYYTRYADDFIVGMAGTSREAIQLKEKLALFLKKKLKLNLRYDKTKLTNLTKKSIRFLGVDIKRRIPREKPIFNQKRVTPRLRMHAPIEELFQKGLKNGFFKKKAGTSKLQATRLNRIVNLDHADIIMYYNRVIRGILNYYSFVDNKKRLGSLIHGFKHSCALTLARKFKLKHRAKVFKRFGTLLKDPVRGKQLTLPRTFKRTREFLVEIKLISTDELFKKQWNRKFTKRVLYKSCIICGDSATEIHHIRKIADLRQKAKINWFKAQMTAIRRKQVPLCKKHHIALHNNKLTLNERNNFSRGLKKL